MDRERTTRLCGIWVSLAIAMVAWGLGWLVRHASGQSPQSELVAAIGDAQTHPAPLTSRYLTLCAIPAGRRADAVAVVGFVLNSVSRADVIVQPVRVSETLMRFDLSQVAPRAADMVEWSTAWEDMAGLDPYWHIHTQVAADESTKAVVTDGGWLDLAAAAELRELTGSIGAVLRADYFVAHSILPPMYYRLSGVPSTEVAWHVNRLGLVTSTVERFRGVQGANMFRSDVTDKPRRLARWPLASGGGLWTTYDVSRPTAARDTFREPRHGQFRYDASEQIATLPTGLHIYALFDSTGGRVSTVPGDIAIDHSPLTPVPVPLAPMLSCVRCHSADGGLIGFADVQDRLLSGRAALLADTPETIQQLVSFYGRQSRLLRRLVRDREDYAEAVALAAAGATPEEIGVLLNDFYLRYAREDVDAARAMAELGIEPTVTDGDDLPARVQFGNRIKGTRDVILMSIAEGIPVQRAQWEVSYAEAALLTAGNGTSNGTSKGEK